MRVHVWAVVVLSTTFIFSLEVDLPIWLIIEAAFYCNQIFKGWHPIRSRTETSPHVYWWLLSSLIAQAKRAKHTLPFGPVVCLWPCLISKCYTTGVWLYVYLSVNDLNAFNLFVPLSKSSLIVLLAACLPEPGLFSQLEVWGLYIVLIFTISVIRCHVSHLIVVNWNAVDT